MHNLHGVALPEYCSVVADTRSSLVGVLSPPPLHPGTSIHLGPRIEPSAPPESDCSLISKASMVINSDGPSVTLPPHDHIIEDTVSSHSASASNSQLTSGESSDF
ncbi:unnamed protein product [Protopolystoma xenopodis]|uniref:Uncharacterized protein n=1 Tax=Protopolystoma xenopodis TaxID=117903 RepID=A0A448WDQ4_9PLAT|nr:unnamed protein product [Protopolystoma xenopodis]